MYRCSVLLLDFLKSQSSIFHKVKGTIERKADIDYSAMSHYPIITYLMIMGKWYPIYICYTDSEMLIFFAALLIFDRDSPHL